jgi:hypothetical protein
MHAGNSTGDAVGNGHIADSAQFLSFGVSGARISTLLFPLVAVFVAFLLWSLSSVLTYQDDAAQYVSTATHLLSGNGLRTSVLYYDSQLIQSAPAAQTVWPAGFPLFAAIVSAVTGLEPDRAVLAVAILSHIGTALMLLLLMRLIGLNRWLALSVAGAWLMFVPSWLSVTRGLSDPMFQFFSMAVAVAIAAYFQPWQQRSSLRSGSAGRRWILVGTLSVMFAILTRYQAVVLIGPLVAAVTVGRFQLQSTAARVFAALIAGLPPVLLLGLLFVRNFWITGSLTGGAVSGRGQSLADVASRIGFVPESLRMSLMLLLIASCLVCAVTAATLWIRDNRKIRLDAPNCPPATRAVLVYCLFAYATNIGLLLYLSLTSTVYGIEMRYLAVCMLFLAPPIVWFIARMVGNWVAAQSTRDADRTLVEYGFAALIVIGSFVQLNTFQPAFVNRLETAPVAQINQILAANPIAGQSSLSWLRENASILMSTHAHSLNLLTQSTVIGVPAAVYTPHTWDEPQIRDLAVRHDVSYVVAFRGLDTWVYRDLINKMLDNNGCPDWLKPVVATPDLVIAKVGNAAGGCGLPVPPARPFVGFGGPVRGAIS